MFGFSNKIEDTMQIIETKKERSNYAMPEKTTVSSSVTLSNGWSVGVVRVTPDLAREMLKNNTENRPVKKTGIARYAAIMQAENWTLSPDGIIFSNDRLIQGQHRLNAVIVSGKSVEFIVWTNVDDNVFKALDRGVSRTASDALGIDRRIAEVSTFICRLGNVGGYSVARKPMDSDVHMISEIFQPYHDFLIENVKGYAPVFSAVPFRAAACLRMASGYDKGYIRDVYERLVLGEVHLLPRIAQSLVAAVAARRVSSKGGGTDAGVDLFARAWVVFDPSKRNNEKLIVRSHESAVNDLKKIVDMVLKEEAK